MAAFDSAVANSMSRVTNSIFRRDLTNSLGNPTLTNSTCSVGERRLKRNQPQASTYVYVRQTTQLQIARSLNWAFNAAAFCFCHELRESSNLNELDASILGDVCGGGAGP